MLSPINCIHCSNPASVVGFYNKSPTQATYDLCPYTTKKTFAKGDYKTSEYDFLAKEIKKLLLTNFDKVIYFLEKELGFRWSDKDLENMLEQYFSMEGHNYIGATLENYPWTFLYLSLNHSLYGKLFQKGSFMYDRITANCKNIVFEKSTIDNCEKLNTKGWSDINCAFIGHTSTPKNGVVKERLKFCLWQDKALVYSKELSFGADYFFNIVNFDTWKTTPRGKRLLDMASKFV